MSLLFNDTKGLEIWTADNGGLNVSMIDSMELPVDGYELLPQEGVPPGDSVIGSMELPMDNYELLSQEGVSPRDSVIGTFRPRKALSHSASRTWRL